MLSNEVPVDYMAGPLFVLFSVMTVIANIPINSMEDSHFSTSLTTPVTFNWLSRLCYDFNLHFPDGYLPTGWPFEKHLFTTFTPFLNQDMCLLAAL